MEIILAFGLGLVLIINIVIVNMALKSSKQVEEYEKRIYMLDKNVHDLERTVDKITSFSEKQSTDLWNESRNTNNRINSQMEKMYLELNQKIDFVRKSISKDYF
jgi:hypothetical protein